MELVSDFGDLFIGSPMLVVGRNPKDRASQNPSKNLLNTEVLVRLLLNLVLFSETTGAKIGIYYLQHENTILKYQSEGVWWSANEIPEMKPNIRIRNRL